MGHLLSHTSLAIGRLKSGTDEYEGIVWIDLAQIVHVEPLPQAAPVQSNGQAGG